MSILIIIGGEKQTDIDQNTHAPEQIHCPCHCLLTALFIRDIGLYDFGNATEGVDHLLGFRCPLHVEIYQGDFCAVAREEDGGCASVTNFPYAKLAYCIPDSENTRNGQRIAEGADLTCEIPPQLRWRLRQ